MPQVYIWNGWLDVDYLQLRPGDIYRWTPEGDIRQLVGVTIGAYKPFIGPMEEPRPCLLCKRREDVFRLRARTAILHAAGCEYYGVDIRLCRACFKEVYT